MFKIKSIDGVEVTPQEEVVQENEVFTEPEQEENVNTEVAEETTEVVVDEPSKLVFDRDEDLVEYVRSKNLIETKDREIPSEIEGYLKYREETNRGLQDYLELQKDLTQVKDEELIKMKMKEENPELTDEEINDDFLDIYGYDEDLDDERDIKKKVRSFKKAHAEALEYYNSLKEQYNTKVEVQQQVSTPEDYEDLRKLYTTQQEQAKIASENFEYFTAKTNELFSDNFEGFKFKIGDEEIVHKPSNIESVKTTQSNVMNFLKKFLDDSGKVKDAEAYHKALYVAMNYESILSNVYETAKAKAIEDEVRNSKNVNMDGLRKSPENLLKGKVKYRVVQ
jgi:hypothetical protein